MNDRYRRFAAPAMRQPHGRLSALCEGVSRDRRTRPIAACRCLAMPRRGFPEADGQHLAQQSLGPMSLMRAYRTIVADA
ncbi:hypothetical protein ACTTAL_19170 (plasmid) [Rhodobacter capsulatus]